MSNRAQLVIAISDQGEVTVTGPLHDKFVCYAMLEAARDTIKEWHDKAKQSRIVPLSPTDLSHLKLANGGKQT